MSNSCGICVIALYLWDNIPNCMLLRSDQELVILTRDMKTNSFKKIFYISLLGAFITSGAYALAIYLRLPPTDSAYQIGFHKLLFDPFVTTIALTYAIPIGVVASPVLYFFLRHKNLKIAYPVIQLLVIISLVIIPNNDKVVITGACIVLISSAFIFWISPIARLNPRG